MNAHGLPPHSRRPEHREQHQAASPHLDLPPDFASASVLPEQGEAVEEGQNLAGASVSGPPSPRAFYGAIGAAGIVVFGALCGLSWVLGPTLVAGGAAAFTAADSARVLLRVKRAGDSLGWRIQSEGDLAVARGVAEMDMKGAAIFMARVWPVLLFCVAGAEVPSALALGLFCALLGPWGVLVEKRFQAMPADDERLAARFGRIVRAWKEPRWKLPRDV